MCGIAGAYAYGVSAPPIDRGELVRIRDHMANRGPDGAGVWISADARAGLAHRRLAILDTTDAGAQPMASADGRLVITFNGEIYNFRALRQELEGKGYAFRSASDTEVLLHLYAERGEEMVHALRGMYAFAIFDDRERRLFAARDPFGIKPLYYADDGKTLRFASQVKALLQSGPIDTEPEAAGHVGFYVWGHVPDPYSLYRGIRALPAGTTLRVDPSGVHRPRSFFSISKSFAEAAESPIARADAAEHIHEALRDSVRHHLVSDVPVGVFLSSGLDSTTIAALAAESNGPGIQSITLGFEEYRGTAQDEVPLAEQVAQAYRLDHRTRRVSQRDFEDRAAQVLEAMDQPSTDGVNTYFVSLAAAERGLKVALSGIGGDEIFGGYPSFTDVPRMVRRFRMGAAMPRLARSVRALTAPLLPRRVSPKYASLLEYGGTFGGAYLTRRALQMPWELYAFLDRDFVDEGWAQLDTLRALAASAASVKDDRRRVSALELGWYLRNQLLRDADWAGMAHSLEIRVPLVDVELFRAVAALGNSTLVSKSALASAPRQALPQEIRSRPKTGFTIPVQTWVAQGAGQGARGLRDWARVVNPPPARASGFRVLALATDAFGGRGGIAKFNRDLLTALCAHSARPKVLALPRIVVDSPGSLPPRLRFVREAARGKSAYLWAFLGTVARSSRFDVIFCLHINLLPLAWLASLRSRCPVVLVIHGIDAWAPPRNPLKRALARRIDGLIAVSALTRDRFLSWSGVDASRTHIVPNCVDLDAFHAGPRRSDLVERYGIASKTVIMTMGRLSAAERYKGVDEVLETLAVSSEALPELIYMVVGEGDDRARLAQKAAALGLGSRVVFTGFVAEHEKADHLNLANAFVMPSRGEGFGIVLLEAMACAVPVVASALDGSREAVRDGALGIVVDPSNRDELARGIRAALQRPRRVPEGLDHFSVECFRQRAHAVLDRYAAVP